MAPAAPKPTRKRNRKRKRRAALSSSESSSSEGDSSSDDAPPPKPKPIPQKVAEPESSESESSSLSDDDEDKSSSESERKGHSPSKTGDVDSMQGIQPTLKNVPRPRSPSPPLTAVEPPSFLPSNSKVDEEEKEKMLKDRFRMFWMESLAEGFRDDLETIRKEPNLGMSKLSLLIDSLASGADVFSSHSGNGNVNEMEVVLENLHS